MTSHERAIFSAGDRVRSKARAYPVAADGRLDLRDLDKLWCYEVKVKRCKRKSPTGVFHFFTHIPNVVQWPQSLGR